MGNGASHVGHLDLQKRTAEHAQALPMSMWVMKVSDLMKLNRMASYEELLKEGLLVKRSKSHYCMFVSHQWLGHTHPDPTLRQLEVLQQALQNLIRGRAKPVSDPHSQFHGDRRQLSVLEQKKIAEGYIWLDWFCIPQDAIETVEDIEISQTVAKMEADQGTDPKPSRSSSSLTSLTTQELYISSIPFYVDLSDIFIALVPQGYHVDTAMLCNFRSYLTRGWCRLEIWCRLLSEKSDQPFLVIKDIDEIEFCTSMFLADRPPHEGEFTINTDRTQIDRVMRQALRARKRSLQETRKWDMYRFTVARRETLLGLPPAKRSLDQFLQDFCFSSLQSAKATKGIGPLECAILSGDHEMIPLLANYGFDLNRNVHAKIDLAPLNGCSLLNFALEIGWRCPEVVTKLLQFRADVNRANQHGFSPLSHCATPEFVDLLVQHRADVNKRACPTFVSPLTACCSRSSPASVISKLIEYRAEVNPESKGFCSPQPLAALAGWSAVNPHCLESARLLLEARSDVNLQAKAKGVFWSLEMLSRARMRLGSSSLLAQVFAEWTTTPLGFACLYGGDEYAEFLLRARADPHIRNARGHTAFDLARTQNVLKVLEGSQTFSV